MHRGSERSAKLLDSASENWPVPDEKKLPRPGTRKLGIRQFQVDAELLIAGIPTNQSVSICAPVLQAAIPQRYPKRAGGLRFTVGYPRGIGNWSSYTGRWPGLFSLSSETVSNLLFARKGDSISIIQDCLPSWKQSRAEGRG